MKRIFLYMILASLGDAALAIEKSSSQTQASATADTKAPSQIISQTVTPTASQEAIAACSGLYEKDSCQFHTSTALVNGTCKILPSGNNNYELGCQPEQSTKNAAVDSGKDVPNTKESHQHKHKRG